MTYEKIDFKKEKPTKSGKYFTWNKVKRLNGEEELEKQITVFDLERDKIWNENPVVFWLKEIND